MAMVWARDKNLPKKTTTPVEKAHEPYIILHNSSLKGEHSMRFKKNGRLGNVEDAHISPKGTDTRVLAKNVMEGDEFLLSGDRIGRVVSNRVTIKPRGETVARMTVRTPKGKTFEKVLDGSVRVMIREYPATRFERRRMSRRGTNRPNYRVVNKRG